MMNGNINAIMLCSKVKELIRIELQAIKDPDSNNSFCAGRNSRSTVGPATATQHWRLHEFNTYTHVLAGSCLVKYPSLCEDVYIYIITSTMSLSPIPPPPFLLTLCLDICINNTRPAGHGVHSYIVQYSLKNTPHTVSRTAHQADRIIIENQSSKMIPKDIFSLNSDLPHP